MSAFSVQQWKIECPAVVLPVVVAPWFWLYLFDLTSLPSCLYYEAGFVSYILLINPFISPVGSVSLESHLHQVTVFVMPSPTILEVRLPRWISSKESACHCRRRRFNPLFQEDLLEKEMAAYSSILAWKNPMDRGAWKATVHGVAEPDTT